MFTAVLMFSPSSAITYFDFFFTSASTRRPITFVSFAINLIPPIFFVVLFTLCYFTYTLFI